MSAKPKPDAKASSDDASKRQSMPFEPKKAASKKAAEKKVAQKPVKAATPSSSSSKRKAPSTQGIPDMVSRRMVKRVALFCGIPTALGMSTFVLSYLSVSQGWYALPTYAVLFVSLGWFGLGVLGVSYGVLSASWDEEHPGSGLGFAEFRENWARMTEAWRSEKQKNKLSKTSPSSKSSKQPSSK